MGNISEEPSFYAENRQRFKDGLIQFHANRQYTHVLTLCWNADAGRRQKIGLQHARRDIGDLLARIDRRLLGTRFHKNRDQRTEAVFFLEHAATNIHAHALIRVRPGRLLDFHRLFRGQRGGVWNRIVPAGTYRLEILDDVRTTAAYCLKEQHLATDDRMTVWADEFYA